MAREQDRTNFVREKYTINHETGEVLKEEHTQQIKKGVEPSFVKLYLDHLLLFSELPKNLSPILLEFLKRTTYADKSDPDGGQIIYINASLKRDVAAITKKSYGRVEHAITDFIKANILNRLDMGKYQVNPRMFGKGEWKDISSIRATYDYKNNDVIADIEETEQEKQENRNSEPTNEKEQADIA